MVRFFLRNIGLGLPGDQLQNMVPDRGVPCRSGLKPAGTIPLLFCYDSCYTMFICLPPEKSNCARPLWGQPGKEP